MKKCLAQRTQAQIFALSAQCVCISTTLDITDRKGYSALMYASQEGHDLVFQNLLIKHGADWRLQNDEGFSALDLTLNENIENHLESLGAREIAREAFLSYLR